MGFISSISQSIRNNKLSRKLSTSKPNRPRYEDSKDLIKIPSNAASLTRADSIASTIRHSTQDPIMPTESPTHRRRLTPADLNLQTLFDNADALDPGTRRTVRALSLPEYPVLKMETVQSPFDTPPKKLQDAFDTEGKWSGKRNVRRTTRRVKNEDGKTETDGVSKNPNRNSGSMIKRSMTGLLKKSTSLKMSRNSSKIRPASTNPRWLNSSSLTDDYFVDEKAELKWLELNGLSSRDTEFGVWNENGFGRPW
ncbi:hypothetical protein N7451_007966 [Penicillium sp. IBT 35674x]|nr:hypothetical protein N7451_007966 [Penicillium sp. IBT 35674x]